MKNIFDSLIEKIMELDRRIFDLEHPDASKKMNDEHYQRAAEWQMKIRQAVAVKIPLMEPVLLRAEVADNKVPIETVVSTGSEKVSAIIDPTKSE